MLSDRDFQKTENYPAPVLEIKNHEIEKEQPDTIETSKQRFEEEKQPSRKKRRGRVIIISIAALALISLIVGLIVLKQTELYRIGVKMQQQYKFAVLTVADDNSYIILDTNSNDKDIENEPYYLAQVYRKEAQDTLDGIRFMNEKLGFSSALYEKMMQTTSLMGRQTEENRRYRISWTYHPDKGLEVMYERK